LTTHAPTTGRRRRTPVTWYRSGGLSTLLFALPMALTFAVFSWWPIVRSLIMSVQKVQYGSEPLFVGLSNFDRVLADPLLGTAIANTLQYVALSVLIGFPVPIIAAVFIGELRRLRGFASALAYLPVVIPPVVAVLLWKQFYAPGPNGLLNSVLGWFGADPVAWLTSADTVIPAIIVQATWAGFGSTTIIYLAALASVRTDLYEAAEADGAKVWRRVWHVTLPQMRGIMLIMLLLQLIGVFQIFTEPYIMTGGGPANASVTILMLIYQYAFVRADYGMATALSLLLALALMVLSGIYLWATRRWSQE
jgi:multiple sugar transport system permease protein